MQIRGAERGTRLPDVRQTIRPPGIHESPLNRSGNRSFHFTGRHPNPSSLQILDSCSMYRQYTGIGLTEGGARRLRQRVFISSVISGYEGYRRAAADSIDYLNRHGLSLQPWRMEVDKQASDHEPQFACLHDVKACPIYVLLMGPRYGYVNPDSGLSATHEEFRIAVADPEKTVFVFVERTGGEWEEGQKTFLQEVGDYVEGRFYREFSNECELQLEIERAFRGGSIGEEWAPNTLQLRESIRKACENLPMVHPYVAIIASPSMQNRNVIQLSEGLESVLLSQEVYRNPRDLGNRAWTSESCPSTEWIQAMSCILKGDENPWNPWALLRVYRTGHMVLSTHDVFSGTDELEFEGARFQRIMWRYMQTIKFFWNDHDVVGNLGLDLVFQTNKISIMRRFPAPPSSTERIRHAAASNITKSFQYARRIIDKRPEAVLEEVIPWVYSAYQYTDVFDWIPEIRQRQRPE